MVLSHIDFVSKICTMLRYDVRRRFDLLQPFNIFHILLYSFLVVYTSNLFRFILCFSYYAPSHLQIGTKPCSSILNVVVL
jgi:hypothetical protein